MKKEESRIRPRIFIGTTDECQSLGIALESNLKHRFEVKLWHRDVFKPNKSYLEDLLEWINKVEYAAFLLTPDDIRVRNGQQTFIPRDNLIFELGLFMGNLGRERVFAILPRKDPPALPTDLQGITFPNYQLDKQTPRSAMKTVANELNKRVDEHLQRGGREEAPPRLEPSIRQIFVCAVEAASRSHIPLREVGHIVACLEDALRTSIDCLQKSPDHVFIEGSRNLSIPVRVRMRNTVATLIWELPEGLSSNRAEIHLALSILDFISLVQSNFQRILMAHAFGQHLPKVGLRVALSTGKILHHVSQFASDGDMGDYMGPCLEEVEILRRSIGPGGTISNLKFAQYLFMERQCAEEGRIECRVAGVNGEQFTVWITDEPLKRRQPKLAPLDSLADVLEWSRQPYLDAGSWDCTLPRLTEADRTFVFEIRETWESQFAQDLARHKDNKTILKRINEDTVNKMHDLFKKIPKAMKHPDWRKYGKKFHSLIAEFSHPDKTVQGQRKKFADWIYEFTGAVYKYGMMDADNAADHKEGVVIREHRKIIKLIKEQQADLVGQHIRHHLQDHYSRAHDRLLKCPM